MVKLLLLLLCLSCASVEKPTVDYNKGWIVDKDGNRHFYNEEVVIGEEMKCLIHGVQEVISVDRKKVKKEFDSE